MIADLHRRPAHLIRRTHQFAWALFLEECAGFNITPVQYAALFAIGETPGIDATRLCGLIAFDRSTIGNVLERLEKRKLIVRKPSLDDRRQKLITLSPEGALVLEKVEPFVTRVQERLLESLDQQEKALFLSFLFRITGTDGTTGEAATAES